MSIPKPGSIPGAGLVNRTLGWLGRSFASRDEKGNEEPGEWRRVERTPEQTTWRNAETDQFVVCTRQYDDAWIARAKPALIDGEPVDLSLTAGPTSREIAEFLARQYMAHELVLAPITAMAPRWH
ncbi:hypothetical protein [Halalkalicoccus salilacus]|uniref:hypothetical protein n=1 Tax=Halalkalicoccus TaxID=332246 RepID=UPI002F96A081